VKSEARRLSVEDSRAHVQEVRNGEAARSSRRGAILAAALELFAVRGYRATSMADIGARVGIRGPSIYKHFASKQEILAEITFSTMDRLIANYSSVVSSTSQVAEQLQWAVESHVRYHARHRFEAFVGTREIYSMEEPGRSKLLARRDVYELGFRELIERGQLEGRFQVLSSRLASYAILDMGMGVAVWYRDDGPMSEDEVVRHYGSIALRIVGAK
jgi:AcrR family transcriptional regulator